MIGTVANLGVLGQSGVRRFVFGAELCELVGGDFCRCEGDVRENGDFELYRVFDFVSGGLVCGSCGLFVL